MPPEPERDRPPGLVRRGWAWLRAPGASFKGRVAHAGVWVFALRATERLFGLARLVVLARLLAPEDFGLFGVALLALSTLETFSQTGFRSALVQRADDIRGHLDTAWTVQIVRGAALAALLYFAAPPVARFFEDPAAAPLLRVLGLVALVEGLTNIGVVHLQKELEFHREFAYKLSGTLVDLTVSIAAALLLRDAWALVYGLLAGRAVRMVASYLVHPYRPRLRFEPARAKELYVFGRWVFGSSVVVFLATQGDDIFLAKVLGLTALGLYQTAYVFSNLAATEVTHVISRVTFPAYAKLQSDAPRLKEGFLRTLSATTALTIPLTAGLVILAPDFVPLFLGAPWTPMVPALQVLAVSGLVRSVAATGGALFQAVGRPHLDFWMNVGRVAVMAAAIYPLTMAYGTEGAALTVVLGITATLPVWWTASRSIVGASRAEVLRLLVPAAVSAALMAAALLALRAAFAPLGGWAFAGAVVLGAGVYAAGIFLFWVRARRGPLQVVYALRGG